MSENEKFGMLLTAARLAGVGFIRIEFNGSCDDGCVEKPSFHPPQPEGTEAWDRPTMDVEHQLDEMAEKWAEAVIDEKMSFDWSNNDGGCGFVEINVLEGTVEMEGNQYEQVSHNIVYETLAWRNGELVPDEGDPA